MSLESPDLSFGSTALGLALADVDLDVDRDYPRSPPRLPELEDDSSTSPLRPRYHDKAAAATGTEGGDHRRGQSIAQGSGPKTPPRLSSPSIPSPLSLHHLGILPVSPLRRQFSSPLRTARTEAELGAEGEAGPGRAEGERSDGDGDADDEQTGQGGDDDADADDDDDGDDDDRRDVLVQRLNDLVSRLSHGRDVGDEGVSALHSKVDEMERVLSLEARKSSPRRSRPRPGRPSSMHFGGGGGGDDRGHHDSFWGSPSPSLFRSRFLDVSSSPSLIREESQAPKPAGQEPPPKPVAIGERPSVSAKDTIRIAAEAEKLNGELEVLVTNCKARQEETDHIHELLITRAERAAQRILFLQSRVRDLEEELKESDSELSFLRLGLKAIEVQSPPDHDQELAQSINNWKLDWARLKNRRNQRRVSGLTVSLTGSPTTPA